MKLPGPGASLHHLEAPAVHLGAGLLPRPAASLPQMPYSLLLSAPPGGTSEGAMTIARFDDQRSWS